METPWKSCTFLNRYDHFYLPRHFGFFIFELLFPIAYVSKTAFYRGVET